MARCEATNATWAHQPSVTPAATRVPAAQGATTGGHLRDSPVRRYADRSRDRGHRRPMLAHDKRGKDAAPRLDDRALTAVDGTDAAGRLVVDVARKAEAPAATVAGSRMMRHWRDFGWAILYMAPALAFF